jgi:hypothetical protein
VLEATFAAQGLRYQVEQIGFYTLYYDFTPQRPVFQDWRDVDGLTGQ